MVRVADPTKRRCSKCSKEFSTASHARRHERNCQGRQDAVEDSRRRCRMCNKEFTRASDAKRHEESNCRVHFEKHKCMFCDYESVSMKARDNHQRRNHRAQELAYIFGK